jgi:hypothetical protein
MRVPDDMLDIIDAPARFDDELEALLKRGKTEAVRILNGTELERRFDEPYARSSVKIAFENEASLRECVRLLRWSDERLRARPDQLMLWEWTSTIRHGMTIKFGVHWYNREFFELRKDAFREPSHAAYYQLFGATADDFAISHEVLGDHPSRD